MGDNFRTGAYLFMHAISSRTLCTYHRPSPGGGPRAGVGTLCKTLLKAVSFPLLYGEHLAGSCQFPPFYMGINNRNAGMMAIGKWTIPKKIMAFIIHRI